MDVWSSSLGHVIASPSICLLVPHNLQHVIKRCDPSSRDLLLTLYCRFIGDAFFAPRPWSIAASRHL